MSFYTGIKKQSGRDNPVEEQLVSSSSTIPNPHNPSFVTDVPWYANMGESAGPLDHQKAREKNLGSISAYTKRGTVDDIKIKFIPGSCENCGATTHKKRDCLERPRKVGAKYTGESLASDDIVPLEIERAAFESKRDRWRGFETEEHSGASTSNIEIFDRAELKAKYVLHMITKEVYEEGMKRNTKKDEVISKAANLRVREDVAKYLLNLDVNSAFYDPKSRSMREDPFGKDSTYRGDNFERFSGEASAAMQARAFAWDNSGRHEVANPTENSRQVQEHAKELERQHQILRDKY